jgi:hypothetical protein
MADAIGGVAMDSPPYDVTLDPERQCKALPNGSIVNEIAGVRAYAIR